jgi:hypothetical protein
VTKWYPFAPTKVMNVWETPEKAISCNSPLFWHLKCTMKIQTIEGGVKEVIESRRAPFQSFLQQADLLGLCFF